MATPRFGPLERDVPQPQVRYCPTCKGDLGSVGSQAGGGDPAKSHNYQCRVCDRIFQIELLDRLRDENVHHGP